MAGSSRVRSSHRARRARYELNSRRLQVRSLRERKKFSEIEITTTPRTTVVQATATGTNGAHTVTAVVDRTTTPPSIQSWRQE